MSEIQAVDGKKTLDAGEPSSLRTRAYICACEAHKSQIDKAGKSYILHPLHVAKQFESEADDTAYVVAILHDVLEDSPLTAQDLLGEPWHIPEPMVRSIESITRCDSDRSYLDYIRRVKQDPVARRVKIEDLKHNMDLSRLPHEPTERDLSRNERYAKALHILEGE